MEMSANQIDDIIKCMKASADMLEQVNRSPDSRKKQAVLLREAARQIQEFSE